MQENLPQLKTSGGGGVAACLNAATYHDVVMQGTSLISY